MLGNVDANGSNLEHGGIVSLQASLGAVEGLGLGDAALHYSSKDRGGGLFNIGKHTEILKKHFESKTNAFKLFIELNNLRFVVHLNHILKKCFLKLLKYIYFTLFA